MELVDLLDAVRDRESFLVFVEALCRDRQAGAEEDTRSPSSPYGPGARGWENTDVDALLGSAAAWARDIAKTGDERSEQFPESASWAVFANFLYAGKIYE